MTNKEKLEFKLYERRAKAKKVPVILNFQQYYNLKYNFECFKDSVAFDNLRILYILRQITFKQYTKGMNDICQRQRHKFN